MIGSEKVDKINGMLEDELDTEQIAEELQVALSTARRYIRLVKQQKGEGEKKIRVPKILLFDIETAMMEIYVWGQYKQRIPDQNVIRDWFILGWSAKWLFNSEVMSDVLTPEEALDRDDIRVLERLWDLLDEADIVIGHNSDRFDIRKVNAKFVLHGFMPPMPYRTVDTLKVCKRHFAFSSYKLDTIAKMFGIEGKIHTGFDLWKECLKGDPLALKKMNKYNIKDTLILEEIYVKIRPWIRSHPNVGLYMDLTEPVCTNCGSSVLDDSGDYYYTTNVNRYKEVRCIDCGSPGRLRKSVITGYPEEYKNNIIVPTAR